MKAAPANNLDLYENFIINHSHLIFLYSKEISASILIQREKKL
jgi:hypothetical protein